MDSNYRALRGGQGTNISGVDIATKPGWKAYQTVQLDTLKLYTQPHGTKTGNLIVNLEEDETLLLAVGERSLASYDCRLYFVPYEGWYMQLADRYRVDQAMRPSSPSSTCRIISPSKQTQSRNGNR